MPFINHEIVVLNVNVALENFSVIWQQANMFLNLDILTSIITFQQLKYAVGFILFTKNIAYVGCYVHTCNIWCYNRQANWS